MPKDRDSQQLRSGGKWRQVNARLWPTSWMHRICSVMTNFSFLPVRRYASAVFATATCPSVRLFVRPSVCHTPVLCLAERKQDHEMYTIWYPHDSSFWQGMNRRKIRNGSLQRNVSNESGVGFFGDFRPICHHISKTVHFSHKSYYRTVTGNHMQAIEWCHFRWLLVTLDPGFKDTVVLKGEHLQSNAFHRHSYYTGQLSIGKLAIQLTTPLLLHKPCKRFASVALVCQWQLAFLVTILL